MFRTAILLCFFFIFTGIFGGNALSATKERKQARCGGGEVTAFMDKPQVRTTLTKGEKRRLKGLKVALIGDGFDKKTVEKLFSGPEIGLYDAVTRLFKHNPEKKADSGEASYKWYKECLGGEKRYATAKKFISRHNEALSGAERRYGVDQSYIVSILGIESNFGRDKGHFKARDALISLYLLVENKKRYSYNQLRHLLRYSNKTAIPIENIRSSYAGAIGCAQFIPFSLNHYFVGKAGKVEDANPFDTTDCIYSIAYYLKESGWRVKHNNSTPKKGTRGWRAIHAYNRSDAYTRFVVEMAGKL